MNTDTLLKVKKLSKSFFKAQSSRFASPAGEQVFILKDLNIEIPKGKVTALIGGNGSGKTTLFNIISGFLKPDAGSIIMNDGNTQVELTMLPAHTISRKGVGRMFQDNHIFRNMSLKDNMLIADHDHRAEYPFSSLFSRRATARGESAKLQKAKEIFEDLLGANNSFIQRLENKAGTLSFGEQRLLGLARLLMGNYSVLLLDEPTSGLNPVLIQEIKLIIRKMVEERGLTVFLIEHNMSVVEDIADFCCLIADGQITKSGIPDVVLHDAEVRRKYMGI